MPFQSSRGAEFVTASIRYRAPRVAVLVPEHDWEFFTREALERLTNIWGGAGDVIVPIAADGSINASIGVALRRFDPDYVCDLSCRLDRIELHRPGLFELRDVRGKRILSPARRAKHLSQDGIGSFTVSMTPDVSKSEILGALPIFRDDGLGRIVSLDPGSVGSPLTSVITSGLRQTINSTGSPLIDLALDLTIGQSSDQTGSGLAYDLSTVTTWKLSERLVSRDLTSLENIPTKFKKTVENLVQVHSRQAEVPNDTFPVVIGDTAADMSVALIWNRTHGNGMWLPTDYRELELTKLVASHLRRFRRQQQTKVTLTSISITEDELRAHQVHLSKTLLDEIEGNAAKELQIEPIEAVVSRGGQNYSAWMVADAWDIRTSLPVIRGDFGSVEMATPFPLQDFPDVPPSKDLIVELSVPDIAVPPRKSLVGAPCFADPKDEYETFVRPTRGGYAFESARFDWVPAGSSNHGRLAQPRLKWSSAEEVLRLIAEDSEVRVEPSSPGKVASVVLDLWESRNELCRDLVGVPRRVLDAFQTSSRRSDEYGIGVVRQGDGYPTFEGLASIANPDWTRDALRAWIDRRVTAGAIRRGLILGCRACPWLAFYRMEDIGQRYVCARCGALNSLTQSVWHQPVDGEPEWFYDLHPSCRELLKDRGDLPILAANTYESTDDKSVSLEFRVVGSDFACELDYAVLDSGRLIVGEAKAGNHLDGKNAAARRVDAEKMLHAANLLQADELSLATSRGWLPSVAQTLRESFMRQRRTFPHRVVLLENVANPKYLKRTTVVQQ